MRGTKRFLKSLWCILLAALLLLSGFPQADNVYATTGNPDFSIARSIDKTSFKEGETGTITYTITPSGTASNSGSISADIVLVFDVSPSMKANKLSNAKHAAQNFLDKLQGSGAKVALVTFGYKVNYKTALSTNYTQLKSYIADIQNKDLFEGTNYNDAFTEAYNILKGGSSRNKYVVFLSDGMPNYFTSSTPVKKYEKNPYYIYDQDTKKYYPTNWPSNTPEAYDNATNNVKAMSKDRITLFNIGLGKKNDIDLGYLTELSNLAGGKTYPSYKDTDLDAIYQSISRDILVAKISNLQILDVLPTGVSLVGSDNAVLRDDGKVQINLQDIVYDSVNSTPGAFTASIKVSFNKSGNYSFNQGIINYTAWNGTNSSKPINTVSVNVTSNLQRPDMDVSRQLDKTSAIEGEIVKLKYTIKPTGVFVDETTQREPVDIVLVMDKSLSMLDRTGSRNATKLTDAKAAAVSFVNSIKEKGYNDRIALVTFNRHSKVDIDLTTNYSSIISKINSIDPNRETYYDQGTNYEIGLGTAKNLLVSNNNSKYIVFLSDGAPNFYVDDYHNHQNIITSDYFNGYKSEEYQRFYYYKYFYGIDNAYQKMRQDYDLADRNLQDGEYTYYMGENIYSEIENTAKDIAKLGITIHTIGLGSPQDLDMDFMSDIAEAGGGNSYESTDSGSLATIFTSISNSITQQKISNITVSMNLPNNVEVLEDTNVTRDGNKVTIRIPDIVFEKDKGTPTTLEYTLKLKFNTSGTYKLKNDASISYNNYLGNQMSKSFNELDLVILKPDYSISKLNAEPVKPGSITTGIILSWDKDEIDLIDNVKEFIIQRSVNGSEFTNIGRVSNLTEIFLDENVGVSGSYIYKIITVVKGQNGASDTLVEGATSNEVQVKNASSNISTIQSVTIVNNLLNSNTVIDGFRVTSRFTITIADESAGVSAGGIENSTFTFTLNRNNNSLMNCNFSSNSKIKLFDRDNKIIAEQVITPETISGTKTKQIVLSYDNVLAPGTYFIEFSFIPVKVLGGSYPEGGIEISNSMKMTWKDNGINQLKNSDQVFAGDNTKNLLFDINVVKKPILN